MPVFSQKYPELPKPPVSNRFSWADSQRRPHYPIPLATSWHFVHHPRNLSRHSEVVTRKTRVTGMGFSGYETPANP
jgi:hypothetical protein